MAAFRLRSTLEILGLSEAEAHAQEYIYFWKSPQRGSQQQIHHLNQPRRPSGFSNSQFRNGARFQVACGEYVFSV